MNPVLVTVVAMVVAGGQALAAGTESAGKAVTEIEATSSDTPTPEPIVCYRALGKVDDEISIGFAVRLCSGTTNGTATVECYAAAWARPTRAGGLGLPRGLAIDLCRTNSLQGS